MAMLKKSQKKKFNLVFFLYNIYLKTQKSDTCKTSRTIINKCNSICRLGLFVFNYTAGVKLDRYMH